MSTKTPQNHLFLMEFPIGLWERFADEAGEKEISKAEIIRNLIRSWLLEQGKKEASHEQ